MLSDCTRQIRDRERWLTGVLAKEGASERELSSLLATAALVRGVVAAIPVPEGFEEASREYCTAAMQDRWKTQRERNDLHRPWPSVLGGWLRVVFTLWRRR